MDKDAFSDRVCACQTKLYWIAASIVRNQVDAQDAVQDALVGAWANLPKLRDEAFFETWLTCILINRCREILRKRVAHPTVALPDDIAAESASDMGLSSAGNALDERYRLQLVMHLVLDMPITQVAWALRVPYSTM